MNRRKQTHIDEGELLAGHVAAPLDAADLPDSENLELLADITAGG
jgi:hypothetical protein